MEVKGVLITGVSGFVGQGLVRALHNDAQFKLFGHGRNVERTQSLFKDCKIQIVNGFDERLLNDHRIHTVIHLAGIAHDLSNQYREEDYYQVNDQATRALYDQFLKSHAKGFIFVSSIKALVDKASIHADELGNPKPISPYGLSKLKAERYIQEQPLNGDKKYYILRPCMIHGPGNKGNLNLLYRYAKTGLPFPLGSFHNKRSFLSAENLNFVLLKLIEEDVSPGIYHLADDGYLSTADLFRLLADASGRRSRVLNVPPRLIRLGFKSILKSRVLDKLTEDMLVSNQKIKTALNCELPVSLREGLIRTIQSFREDL